jgi:hypothetical protein
MSKVKWIVVRVCRRRIVSSLAEQLNVAKLVYMTVCYIVSVEERIFSHKTTNERTCSHMVHLYKLPSLIQMRT